MARPTGSGKFNKPQAIAAVKAAGLGRRAGAKALAMSESTVKVHWSDEPVTRLVERIRSHNADLALELHAEVIRSLIADLRKDTLDHKVRTALREHALKVIGSGEPVFPAASPAAVPEAGQGFTLTQVLQTVQARLVNPHAGPAAPNNGTAHASD